MAENMLPTGSVKVSHRHCNFLPGQKRSKIGTGLVEVTYYKMPLHEHSKHIMYLPDHDVFLF